MRLFLPFQFDSKDLFRVFANLTVDAVNERFVVREDVFKSSERDVYDFYSFFKEVSAENLNFWDYLKVA